MCFSRWEQFVCGTLRFPSSALLTQHWAVWFYNSAVVLLSTVGMLCTYCTASASLFKESGVCFQMLSVSAVFSGVLLCLLKSLLMWEFLWTLSRRLELLGNVLSRPSARQCFLLKQKLHKSKCPVQWIFTVNFHKYLLIWLPIQKWNTRQVPGVPVSKCPTLLPQVNCLLTSLAYSIVDLALLGFEPHINGIMQCAVSELLVQPVCGGHVAAVCPSTAVWHDNVLSLPLLLPTDWGLYLAFFCHKENLLEFQKYMHWILFYLLFQSFEFCYVAQAGFGVCESSRLALNSLYTAGLNCPSFCLILWSAEIIVVCLAWTFFFLSSFW